MLAAQHGGSQPFAQRRRFSRTGRPDKNVRPARAVFFVRRWTPERRQRVAHRRPFGDGHFRRLRAVRRAQFQFQPVGKFRQQSQRFQPGDAAPAVRRARRRQLDFLVTCFAKRHIRIHAGGHRMSRFLGGHARRHFNLTGAMQQPRKPARRHLAHAHDDRFRPQVFLHEAHGVIGVFSDEGGQFHLFSAFEARNHRRVLHLHTRGNFRV